MYRHYILIISASIKLQYPFVCVAHNKLSHAAQAQATGFADAQHNSKEVLAKRVHYMCVAGAFSSPLTLSRNFTYTNTPAFIHLLRSRRCRIITPRARFVVGRVDQGKKMKFHFLQGRNYARRTHQVLAPCYYFASAHAHRTDEFRPL
jgi:hypothetical protein